MLDDEETIKSAGGLVYTLNNDAYEKAQKAKEERMHKLAARLGVKPHDGSGGYVFYGYEITDLINAFLDKLEGK